MTFPKNLLRLIFNFRSYYYFQRLFLKVLKKLHCQINSKWPCLRLFLLFEVIFNLSKRFLGFLELGSCGEHTEYKTLGLPKIHFRTENTDQITKKIRKNKKFRIFSGFSSVFSALKCILACTFGIRRALYSVRGPHDPNSRKVTGKIRETFPESRKTSISFRVPQITVSGSTPTPWSGPFRDHGLRHWSQSPSEHRKS